MTMTDLFLAELEREVPRTRRALEQVPEGRHDWKPHPKSMALGYLAALVATLPSWTYFTIMQDELDIRPVGVPVTQRVYDPGSGHIAIRVDDLDRMLGRLERAGITPRSAPIKLEDPEWWRGARCVYLTDPDGATIELVERPRRR